MSKIDKAEKFAEWADNLSATEFAYFLQTSPQQVQNLKTQGLKQKENGKYSVKEYIRFVIDREKKEEGALSALDIERIRKTSADATLAEMRIAEAEGRLVDRTVQVRKIRTYLVTVTKLLQDVPKRMARRFKPDERERVIENLHEEIKDILSSLEKAHVEIN